MQLPFDKFREECGVMGIYAHPEAAKLAYLGLYALQHRGQESAGITSSDSGSLRVPSIPIATRRNRPACTMRN